MARTYCGMPSGAPSASPAHSKCVAASALTQKPSKTMALARVALRGQATPSASSSTLRPAGSRQRSGSRKTRRAPAGPRARGGASVVSRTAIGQAGQSSALSRGEVKRAGAARGPSTHHIKYLAPDRALAWSLQFAAHAPSPAIAIAYRRVCRRASSIGFRSLKPYLDRSPERQLGRYERHRHPVGAPVRG